MIIQIYEIQTPDEARAMIDLGVDHIGSVLLSEDQWRIPAIKEVVETVQAAGRKSSLIPLFCDTNRIAQAIRFYRPDIIHFCEALPLGKGFKESVEKAFVRQAAIRREFPQIEIMRTIPITSDGGCEDPVVELATRFAPISDWFLTDTVLAGSVEDQPVNGFVGITGRPCNWSSARKLVQATRVPVILAGGIGPENVHSAVAQVQPAGVDSCTLTNAVDAVGKPLRFKKDPLKVAALVESARNTLFCDDNAPA
jgi:phosphoribosylanthranilate isomerase